MMENKIIKTPPITLIALLNFAVILTIVWFIPVTGPGQYLLSIFVYILIFFGFLYSLRKRRGHLSMQEILPEINIIRRSHDLVQHWLLPLVEIISFWALIYFINLPVIHLALSILQALAFWVLANNILHYFRKENQEEVHTHYIYDVLSLFTVFFASYATFLAANYFSLPMIIAQVFIFGLIILIAVVSGERYLFKKLALLVLTIIIVCLVLLGLQFFGFISIAKISFLLALLIYFLLNFLQHYAKNEHRELVLFLEYSLLLGLILVVLWQIRV